MSTESKPTKRREWDAMDAVAIAGVIFMVLVFVWVVVAQVLEIPVIEP